MGETTNISWTDHTHNGWWGCIEVSEGCTNCYAREFAKRMGFNVWGPSQTTERHLFGDKHWDEPLKWDRKAAKEGRQHRVFCASMADVFEDHPQLPLQRARLWTLIQMTPHLDWQLLTKRPENIMRMVPHTWDAGFPENVWVGTSIENRAVMRPRLAELRKVPATVRFLSCEPLLETLFGLNLQGIHWVIGGGESAGPEERRLVDRCVYGETVCGTAHWCGRLNQKRTPVAHPNGDPCQVCGCPGWVLNVKGKAAALHLRDLCRETGVALWWKQNGGPRPTSGGHLLDGVEHRQMPREAVHA